MRNFLYKIVIENDSKRGRYFDVFIKSLIILSLASFSIETLPNLNANYHLLLDRFEIFVVLIFSIEYILRVFLTKPSWKYIFSFHGITDLIAVLPFYLAIGDLRSIRLFRLLRIFKLFKYNTALDRINSAFSQIKHELFIFVFATILLLYISAIGIYHFENPAQPEVFKSVFHSFWWAIGALFGYGEMFPITVGGKIFSAIIVFIGIAMISIPTGLLASAFSKTIKKEETDD